MPLPDLVRPPVAGAKDPLIGASIVKTVDEPAVWMMISRFEGVRSEPAPIPVPPLEIVAEAVARTPPLARSRLRKALMTSEPPVSKVSELTWLLVRLAASAPEDTPAALIRTLESATTVPAAAGVLISVLLLSARIPRFAVASETAKLTPVPVSEGS